MCVDVLLRDPMSDFGLTDKWNTQSRHFVEGAMKIGLLVFCFLFSPTQEVIAQERLSPNQTVTRNIEPGKTDLFSIALNDGDYFNVSIGYKGRVNFFVLNPDGTIARRLVGTSAQGKPSFPFAAAAAGPHSFKSHTPVAQ